MQSESVDTFQKKGELWTSSSIQMKEIEFLKYRAIGWIFEAIFLLLGYLPPRGKGQTKIQKPGIHKTERESKFVEKNYRLSRKTVCHLSLHRNFIVPRKKNKNNSALEGTIWPSVYLLRNQYLLIIDYNLWSIVLI